MEKIEKGLTEMNIILNDEKNVLLYNMFDVPRLLMILVVYFILYGLLLWAKPDILFDPSKKALRPFGVGYKNSTILPLWLASLLLAMASYFIVLYFIHIRYQTVFI